MNHLEMLVLTTGSREEAARALEDIKGLERAGWIELTDYAVLGNDPQGTLRVYESASSGAEEPGEWRLAAISDADSGRVRGWTLRPGSGHGGTVWRAGGGGAGKQRPYCARASKWRECRTALHSAVERTKANLQWLQGVLRGEMESGAAGCRGARGLESTDRRRKSRAGAEQEILQVRLRTLAGALEGASENREQLWETQGRARARSRQKSPRSTVNSRNAARI